MKTAYGELYGSTAQSLYNSIVYKIGPESARDLETVKYMYQSEWIDAREYGILRQCLASPIPPLDDSNVLAATTPITEPFTLAKPSDPVTLAIQTAQTIASQASAVNPVPDIPSFLVSENKTINDPTATTSIPILTTTPTGNSGSITGVSDPPPFLVSQSTTYTPQTVPASPAGNANAVLDALGITGSPVPPIPTTGLTGVVSQVTDVVAANKQLVMALAAVAVLVLVMRS
jgi:hypothetical protein